MITADAMRLSPSEFKDTGQGHRISKSHIALKADSPILKLSATANNKRSKYDLIEVIASQSLDTYLSLKSKTDLDLYVYKKNPSEKYTFPIVSSTKPENKTEQAFTTLEKNRRYYIGIVRNSPIAPTLPKQLNYKLNIKVTKENESDTMILPNDPLFSKQWYLYNLSQAKQLQDNRVNTPLNFDIGAPEGWQCRKQSTDKNGQGKPSVVAIIDGAVDFNHPDLKQSKWSPTIATPLNRENDEWNIVNRYFNTPASLNNHATHVAGIIAATPNNNIGITGLSWNSKIMSLNVYPSGSNASDTYIIDAIKYAVQNGADVINMSLGKPIKISSRYLKKSNLLELDQDIKQNILDYRKAFRMARKNNVLIVMAAGNDGQIDHDIQRWDNIGDLNKYSLAPYDYANNKDNIILVGSVGSNRRITSYSNHAKRVDIAAPGGSRQINYEYDEVTGQITPIREIESNDERTRSYQIYSTVLNDQYDYNLGTSMAAPMVTATAAVIKELKPDLKAAEIKQLILSNARTESSLEPFVKNGGYLHFYDAIQDATNCVNSEFI